MRWLVWAILEKLKGDTQWWMYTEGEDVERLMTGDPLLPYKARRRMEGWYRAAVDHFPSLAQVTLVGIMAERVELYRAIPPLW